MHPDKKRRLAAIMFADIVGYTAMMQRNEQKGLASVHRFSEVVEAQASAYHGEILEFRGDGCLAVFDSAVEAVHAAKAIQEELQQAPAIPLRIGIHIGDIVFTKGNIYGNGVNLASRVESMGVPGSILVTERVIHDVKSHPEFEMASLGRFQFKNVEKPMEVFALANEGLTVPRPEQMKGKGEKVKEPATSSNSLIRFASIGFVAMAAGAVLFWALGSQRSGKAELQDKDIHEEKVAVAIFENFTGDENLDALGYMASEWITLGLQEIGVNTLSPEMIRQYQSYIGILPDNPEDKPSFAEITHAQYLISGSYSPKGDSLRLITRLTDTQTGEAVQQFPVIKGLKSEKENLVEEARKRLMGYWEVEKNQYFPKINPPKYEAYQQYLSCDAVPCMLKVLALDSTFILGHVTLMKNCSWWEQDSIFHTSEAYVQENWEACTEYEKNLYFYAKAIWEGDYERAYEVAKLNYDKEPRNINAIREMLSVSIILNRVEVAHQIHQQLFAEYDILKDKIRPGHLNGYVNQLNRLKRFEDGIEFIQHPPEGGWGNKERMDRGYAMRLFRAFLETGQKEKGLEYMEGFLQRTASRNELSRASMVWSTVFQDSIPNPFHEVIRQRIDEYPSFKTAGNWEIVGGGGRFGDFWIQEYQYYVLGEWEEAEKRFLALRGLEWNPQNPLYATLVRGTIEPRIEAILGAIYARQGEVEKAMAQVEKLEQLRDKVPEKHSPNIKGFLSWYQARIYAILGDKEAAAAQLQRAFEEGLNLGSRKIFHMDLASLRGYAPYERLVEGAE